MASAVALVSVAACGSDSAAEDTGPIAQVADLPREYAEDDLMGVGFKVGKRYDVEGLTGARSAINGFWRIAGVSVEFEARFYGSHDDAVSLGTRFADEASGETALLVSGKPAWDEGTRDRRVVFDWRSPPTAKYGAYVIRSNMVLLCEGKDPNQGFEHCGTLLAAMEAE